MAGMRLGDLNLRIRGMEGPQSEKKLNVCQCSGGVYLHSLFLEVLVAFQIDPQEMRDWKGWDVSLEEH